MKGIRAQWLACTGATMAVFVGGTVLGWATTILPRLTDPDSPCQLTNGEIGWVMSIAELGFMIGPILMWLIVDKVGRKFTMIMSVVPMIASYVIMSIRMDYTCFMIGRILGGAGSGVARSVTPLYIGEIADNNVRGSMGVLTAISASAGNLFVIIVGAYVDLMWLHIICSILTTVLMMVWFFIPESPYYYLIRDDPDRATATLIWLRGKSDVSEELASMKEYVEGMKTQNTSLFDIFTGRGNRRAFIILMLVIGVPILGGSLAVSSYAYEIFDESGYTGSVDTVVIIMGVCSMIASFAGVFAVDALGRRPLFFIGIGIMAICMLGNGTYYSLKELQYDVSKYTMFPLAMIMGYIISHWCGPHSLPPVILSEYFTAGIKAKAAMLVTVILAVVGLATMKMFQVLQDTVGLGAMFFMFAGYLIVGMLILYFMLPETKKCTFQDIVDMHSRGKKG